MCIEMKVFRIVTLFLFFFCYVINTYFGEFYVRLVTCSTRYCKPNLSCLPYVLDVMPCVCMFKFPLWNSTLRHFLNYSTFLWKMHHWNIQEEWKITLQCSPKTICLFLLVRFVEKVAISDILSANSKCLSTKSTE